MRNSQKKLLIGLMIISILSVFSCTTDLCGSSSWFDDLFSEPEAPKTHTSTTGTSTWSIGYSNDTDPSNLLNITDQESISIDSDQYLSVELMFDMSLSQAEASFSWPSFSIIPKAYACSAVPYNWNYTTIKDIKITSDQDFNAQYPAGSNLAELFFVINNASYQNYFVNNTEITLNQFLNEQPHENHYIHLKLSEWPALDMQHQFTIEYNNNLGIYLSFDSPKINFKI